MKKLLTTAAAAALLVTGSNAMAQAFGEDTLTVGSTVNPECDVNAVSNNVNIGISLDQTVGELTIECNIPGQIQLSFTSANGDPGSAYLKDNSNPSTILIPYTLDLIYEPGILAFIIEPTNLDNEELPFTSTFDNTSGDFIDPKNVEVRMNIDSADLPGVGGLFAGDYTDIIFLGVTAL